MSYRVRTLRRAQGDVDSILHWITETRQSPQGAAMWLEAFDAAIADVADSPLSHALARENRDAPVEIRQVLFKTRHGRTYRAVFCIVGDEVRILRVRGPGQPDLTSDELAVRDED